MTRMSLHKWRIRRQRWGGHWIVLAPGSNFHPEIIAETFAEAVKELDRLRTGRRK